MLLSAQCYPQQTAQQGLCLLPAWATDSHAFMVHTSTYSPVAQCNPPCPTCLPPCAPTPQSTQHKLETEVLAPLHRWQEVYAQLGVRAMAGQHESCITCSLHLPCPLPWHMSTA